MTLSILFSFFISSLILAIAPGPDIIFLLSHTAIYRFKRTMFVIFGLCTGAIIQTICMMVGLTAFITSVPALMIALKVLGGCYLLYLASMAVIHAKSVAKLDVNEADVEAERITPKKLWRRGIIMNLTNVKVQLFFLSFFPQFIPKHLLGWDLMFAIGILGVIFVFCSFLVFTVVAYFAGRLVDQFRSVKFNVALNITAAVIFTGMALFTLFSIVSDL